MFRCQKCNKVSRSGQKENRIVTKKRSKTYVNGKKESTGWEIEKEIIVCDSCMNAHKSDNGEISNELVQ